MSDYTWAELSPHDLHDDGNPPNVPGGLRGSGVFSDPDDAFEYLNRGALLQVIDEEGNVVVNPIVHLVKMTDPNFDEGFYQVWIAEDSGNAG